MSIPRDEAPRSCSPCREREFSVSRRRDGRRNPGQGFSTNGEALPLFRTIHPNMKTILLLAALVALIGLTTSCTTNASATYGGGAGYTTGST